MALRSLIVLACIAAAAGCAGSQPTRTAAGPAQLIERAKLAGNPGRQFSRISPDGEWLSWLAPHEGVMNLWIAPVATPERAKLLTDERTDRVSNYAWSPDGGSLLYTKDRGG